MSDRPEVFARDPVSILPPNATPLERDLDLLGHRLTGLPEPVAHLWNPWTIPEDLLPWLAWAFSVDAWEARWPIGQRRAVVAASIPIHRIKGTKGAVRRALAALGIGAELSEWFDYDGRPHTFRIVARPTVDLIGDPTIPFLSRELRELTETVLDAVKPVRSHYDLGFSLGFTGGRSIGAATAVRHRACRAVHPVSRAAGSGARGIGAGLVVRGRSSRAFAPRVLASGLARPAMIAALRVSHRQRLDLAGAAS